MNKWLREQGVSESLISDIDKFREKYQLSNEDQKRVHKPLYPFFGKEALEIAITVLLDGGNLLLTGEKATGKNVLAENLSYLFNRPVYNASFNINTDSNSLLGCDTFKNNEVIFQPGLIMECAEKGGFGIFDEINMAKNEALSVLHSALDHRRIIDISGYERKEIHEATRFIGTMNYGYAGTRELNEALASRFMILELQPLGKDTLDQILNVEFADLNFKIKDEIIGFFLDIQRKALNSEISSKTVDLRGLIGGIKAVRRGLTPYTAFTVGIVNKTFDEFERKVAKDVLKLRFPRDYKGEDFFFNKMAIRTIRYEDDELLRKISKPVKEMTPRIKTLISDMIETMNAEDGVGIAAPQVGVLKRIFIIKDEEGNPKVFINPEIIEEVGSESGVEGCLSVKSVCLGWVYRPTYIKVKALDENFNEFECELENFIAREFCHENDHLNGILYIDKMTKVYIGDEEE